MKGITMENQKKLWMLDQIKEIKNKHNVGTRNIYKVLTLRLVHEELAREVSEKTGRKISYRFLMNFLKRFEWAISCIISYQMLSFRYKYGDEYDIQKLTCGLKIVAFEEKIEESKIDSDQMVFYPEYQKFMFEEFSFLHSHYPKKVKEVEKIISKVKLRLAGSSLTTTLEDIEEFFLHFIPKLEKGETVNNTSTEFDQFEQFAQMRNHLELKRSGITKSLKKLFSSFADDMEEELTSQEKLLLYSPDCLYERAKREMILGRMEVEQEIAIATCFQHNIFSKISAEMIEEVKENLKKMITNATVELKRFQEQMQSPDPFLKHWSTDTAKLIQEYIGSRRYQLKALTTSKPFLLKYFNS